MGHGDMRGPVVFDVTGEAGGVSPVSLVGLQHFLVHLPRERGKLIFSEQRKGHATGLEVLAGGLGKVMFIQHDHLRTLASSNHVQIRGLFLCEELALGPQCIHGVLDVLSVKMTDDNAARACRS